MFLNSSNKRFGWLVALALCPVVGWGQEIIEHPQGVTVCAGKVAVFRTETNGDVTSWIIDGMPLGDLPPETLHQIKISFMNTEYFSTIQTLAIDYNEAFNGLEVRSIVGSFSGSNVTSTAAYLFYETNQQFAVTGLPPTITNNTAQFHWIEPDSNQTTRFFFGVYDSNNNQLTNETTDATQISYGLPLRIDDACQQLEFRLTAVEVQYPECPDVLEQTHYSTYLYTNPNVSPVTAEFDNNQTVLVNWTPDGNAVYRIIFTDSHRGIVVLVYRNDPPFSHTLALCGQYNLKVAVSPVRCGAEPAFTHSDNISFTIPCPTTPTTATETETEITYEHSGASTIYPSLLAVVSIVPLLIFARECYLLNRFAKMPRLVKRLR